MGEYMPKVGDRVRVTLGENVLVGDVENVYSDGLVDVEVGLSFLACHPKEGWRFEPVVELPTKIGAVIRLSNRELWVRRDRDNFPWGSLEGLFAEMSDREVLVIGFTIEFEGLDE